MLGGRFKLTAAYNLAKLVLNTLKLSPLFLTNSPLTLNQENMWRSWGRAALANQRLQSSSNIFTGFRVDKFFLGMKTRTN